MRTMRRNTDRALNGTVAALALVAAAQACSGDGAAARLAGSPLAAAPPSMRVLSVASCAPGAGGFTIAFTNPYFPAPVGRQWIYEGEEDGEAVSVQITVLDMTRTIAGVTTRVIEEREFVDGELLEVSWNYYVQASDGSVCYYGEDVDIYEEGGITHEGAWCASASGNAPGIFVPGDPRPGAMFPMEQAPGIAEDQGKVVGSGPVEVPLGRFTETIRIEESNPLEGGKGYKVFAAGVGLVVDGPLELTAVNQTSGVPDQPVLTQQVCGT
ncbi:MAG TPA: hypothetical protein VLE53_15615 [Gemmatimonadaceae bacterium]|nr:hypothetical protein [Gemmatimonadaceae bacterium]